MRLAKGSKKVFMKIGKNQKVGTFVLEMIKDDPYPYPVEIDLPSWTVKNDNDFRRWLLGFREGIIKKVLQNLWKRLSQTYQN